MNREKPVLWLFIAPLNHPELCYALSSTAWAAEQAGVKLECYLECERQGDLFAQTGSTVLGGHHHQQFNYLHVVFDVKLLILCDHSVFASSAALFGDETLIQAQTLPDYYAQLVALGARPDCTLCAPPVIRPNPEKPDGVIDIAPYLYMEICFSRALAYPDASAALTAAQEHSIPCRGLWTPPQPGVQMIDSLRPGDTYGSLTLRQARRWQHLAKAVAFGDPDAIRSQLPALWREKRISVYAPAVPKPLEQVRVGSYMECTSAIIEETAELAKAVGNPVLVGRQTGDGDLFALGRHGVSIQIMDPNRPAFPIVSTIGHTWAEVAGDLWQDEPDDATLEKWAKEGRVLSALIFHSGEMAHNEAMLNLFDLCSFTGLKLGIAAHLARYQTCPQQWELLQVPVSRGGVRGRIEPVLHAGGLGVMAEAECPAELLKAHCQQALSGIEQIAGKKNTPRGYYFFCDTDMSTLTATRPDLYRVLEQVGLEYAVSSAMPGRNRLLGEGIPVLTQTSRTLCPGSPFVRITTQEDVYESGFVTSPGWFIGTLDAPVISFSPYIWRKGSRFMQLIDAVCNGWMINVLPHTISRYAKVLDRMGLLPHGVKP